MLGTQIRKRADRFFLSLLFIGFSRSVSIQLWIDRVVSSLHEAFVSLVALQYSDAEVLAVRRHLRNIDEGELNDKIDLGGSLQRNRAVNQSILIGHTGRGKRRVFKLNIDLAVN